MSYVQYAVSQAFSSKQAYMNLEVGALLVIYSFLLAFGSPLTGPLEWLCRGEMILLLHFCRWKFSECERHNPQNKNPSGWIVALSLQPWFVQKLHSIKPVQCLSSQHVWDSLHIPPCTTSCFNSDSIYFHFQFVTCALYSTRDESQRWGVCTWSSLMHLS